jgi:NAD(P)-dependent dehydrogenase (short-subunit alcohol dehydrogenase family)
MSQRDGLITGVSSGFGRIMPEQLLARGDRIAGTVRDLSVMDDLKARYGDRLWLAELDLSKIASIRGVVDRAWAALDRIDVVVGNADYGLMGDAEEPMVEYSVTPMGRLFIEPIEMLYARGAKNDDAFRPIADVGGAARLDTLRGLH